MHPATTHLTLSGALVALGLLLPSAAHAQMTAGEPLGFSQLSNQSIAPARLQLKTLGKGWQRLTIDGGGDDAYAAIYGGLRGAMYQNVLAEAGIGVYFTKGQSVTLGDQTFLVAYRVENKMAAQDMQNIFMNVRGNDGPDDGPPKFAGDTTLLLSLLNLRNVGSLKDVRPFDPSRDILSPADIIASSNNNLEALGGYLVQFAQPNNYYSQQGIPLNTPANLRNSFNRYFHPRMTIFAHPQTREPYRTNPEAAKVPLRLVSNKARVVAIYEGRPGTDGKYGTVFLDGHVERVPVSRWKAVRAVLPQRPTGLEARRLSDTNLRQLRNQVLNYTRLRGGLLPRMHNANVLRRELINYTGSYNATYYNNPLNNEAYSPNHLLSSKNLRQITNLSKLIAFYEASPDSQGKRTAIFLDGHIERIPSSQWSKVRATKVQMKPTSKSKAA